MKLSSYLCMHAAACAGPHAHTYNNQKIKIKKTSLGNPSSVFFLSPGNPRHHMGPWMVSVLEKIGGIAGWSGPNY